MYILINSSFGGVKYFDFKLLEVLEARTHLNNNNKKTLFVHITNIQVALASSMAGSRSSCGAIRNYPSLALLSFVLASFSGSPSVVARRPPAVLGIRCASLAIQPKEILSLPTI